MILTGVLLLLLTGFSAASDPNALADHIIGRLLEYALDNTWSWMKLPPIGINSTYYHYDALAEPLPTYSIKNIFRKGNAWYETTGVGQLLCVIVGMTNLNTGYQIFSHDDDGECTFVKILSSESPNSAVLKILIHPHFDGNCTGLVHTYQVYQFTSAVLRPDPVLCGQKSRDLILQDLSNLHQPNIRAALQIYVPVAVTDLIKDINFCP